MSKSSRIRRKPNSGDCLPVSCFASENSCFRNSHEQKLQNSAQAEFWDSMPVSCFASENSCFRNSHEQKLQNSEQAEFWDSMPVSALASGKPCIIIMPYAKAPEFGEAEFWDCTPVLAFETGIFFRGFGSWLLVSWGFLCAKAGYPDQRFCRWKLLFYQQPCAKAKEFGEAEFWGLFAGVLWRNLVFAFIKQDCLYSQL